ncbi:hypothetical protein FNV43_RR22562 [Rhamnella rubrinervis]|uniref:Reticulon-like protein n=1 Tax=Rhamnella rubrinervis TaxID=2594499 RepID=A0A8K0DUJ9_9ROSA|nr:hypothetical protein FNV43_RR22562 [Rhamnella rubrinervis]
MSSGRPKDGDLRMVMAPEKGSLALPPKPPSASGSTALVEYKPPVMEEEEDLEIKLRRILENVPVRVSNTSGSSAGSGSGDFHQYRQMRRKEQDRLARMDVDYQRRKELAEFTIRRDERLKAAEERTAKKRLKRQKKKQRKREKKSKVNAGGEENENKEGSSDEEEDSDNETLIAMGDSTPSRRISVYEALGGGPVADVLLWKKWYGGVVVLISATTFWFLFERAGYNLVSFVANVILLLVVILFLWAKSASLLNRPLPPLPNLEISEVTVVRVSDALRVLINYTLVVARDIAVGRNIKVFLQVAFGLWVASYIGSLFNFLTLVYIGVILSLSVPVLYDKYQDHIDDKLCVTHRIIQTQYRKIDENILRKIPMASYKEKKLQ